jgi:glucokinase
MGTYGGIDLGGTKIQTIVMAADGEEHRVCGTGRLPTPREGGPRAVVKAMARCMKEAVQNAGEPITQLDGVGVGSPGEIDGASGVVARAGNLPGWDGPHPVGGELSELLGVPVRLGNDVDRATWAEFVLGAGREAGSLLGVFWGTGIGGGIVLDGKLWQGRGGAGEIGHMVIRHGGARCTCGRRGCLEAYAGRAAMEARAQRKVKLGQKSKLFEIMRSRDRDRLTSGVWEEALGQGDDLAQQLIARAVRALGSGIASAVNLLDVDLVVLGGGLGTRFGEEMAARVSRAMGPHLFHDDRPPTVKVAELGDLGGAIGAALLCEP